jgi:hypothetical protein
MELVSFESDWKSGVETMEGGAIFHDPGIEQDEAVDGR